MDLNEIFRLPNVILVDYPTFVFNTTKQELVLNPEWDRNDITEVCTCKLELFKSLEEIIEMINENELVAILKNSIEPILDIEYNFSIKYKIIK